MTAPARRPKRQRKHDRLLHQDATRQETSAAMAIAPFDEMARAMDAKWGTDRLPALVSPEIAAKYGAALGSLNEAIRGNDPQAVADNAANCIRGMQAMDKMAEESGAKPPAANYWIAENDGKSFAIAQDDRAVAAIKSGNPELYVVTLHEVAVALNAWKFDWLDGLKSDFPGAAVVDARPKSTLPDEFWKNGGDDLGF